MRTRFKPPVHKKFFHSKRKIDSKDISHLKKRIANLNLKKTKREQIKDEK